MENKKIILTDEEIIYLLTNLIRDIKYLKLHKEANPKYSVDRIKWLNNLGLKFILLNKKENENSK